MLRFVPLLLWVWAAPVHAEEISSEGRFSFEIKSCPTVPAQSVRRILNIETGGLLVGENESMSATHARLSIRCVGHFARLEADGPSVITPVEQVVDLEAFPEDAAARALALAGLELLATMSSAVRARLDSLQQSPPATATSSEVPSAPVPKTTTPNTTPSKTTPPNTAQTPAPSVHDTRQPAPPMGDTRLGLAGSWRSFFRSHGASLWGGRLEASTTLGTLWFAALDGEVVGARSRQEGLGDVDALSFSSALTFGARLQQGAWGVSLGMGGRLGLIRMTGRNANSSTVSPSTAQHPWGGPLLMTCASARLGRFSLLLSAEAGYSFLVLDGLAGDKTAMSVGGPWIGLALGGGLHL